MRKIRLGRGTKYALVDDDDYEALARYPWRCVNGYAAYVTYKKGRVYSGITLMHRVVAKTPEGLQTDHINRNPLDNRKKNLRWSTSSQNQHNRRSAGVTFNKRKKKWVAMIKLGSKHTFLGLFATRYAARRTYLKAKKKHVSFSPPAARHQRIP